MQLGCVGMGWWAQESQLEMGLARGAKEDKKSFYMYINQKSTFMVKTG